jgi:membrane-bound ClpP family serine protease
VGYFAWRTVRNSPATGPEELIGSIGQARTDLAPEGQVFVDGCHWRAENVGGDPIYAGDKVRVEGRDRLKLQVKRAEPLPPRPAWDRMLE